MKKRLLSFLLAFAMVLPYLAMGVPAVSAASGVLVISDLDAPAVGQAPDYTVTLDEGYSLDDMEWWYYDPAVQSLEYMRDGDTFRENTYYECRIIINVEDGIYPDGAQVVGATHVEEGYGSDMVSVFAGYANGCEAITHIDVFGIPETIEVGQAPSFDQYINDSRYDVVSTWTDSDYNELEAGELFAANEDYELRVEFYPKAGYYFEENASIFTPVDVDGMLAGGSEAFVRKEYTTKQIITEMEFTLDLPQAGQTAQSAQAYAPEGAPYSVEKVDWFICATDSITHGILQAEDAFLSGRNYFAKVHVVIDEGVAYEEYGVDLVCNGEKLYINDAGENALTFVYYYSLDTQAIASVDVSEAPAAIYPGQTPVMSLESPEPEKYIFRICWVDEDWNELGENDTFALGHTYIMNIEVIPQEGYHLDEDASVSTPAAVIYDMSTGFSKPWGTVYIEYELYDLVDTVEVTGLSDPVVGEKLDHEIQLPEDAGYVLDYVQWYQYDYNMADTVPVEEDHVAQDGNVYICFIRLMNRDDSRFNEELSVTLNGEEAMDVSYNNVEVSIGAEYLLGVEVLDQIDLTNLPVTVQPGDVLQPVDVSLEPEKYSVEAYWLDASWDELEPGTVAQLNQKYCLQIYACPKPGYVFAKSDTRYLLAEDRSYEEFSYYTDLFFADATAYFDVRKEISRIDLQNVAVPVAGQSATVADITVPADADYSVMDAWWQDGSGEEFTGKFVAGERYTLAVMLSRQEGIRLDNCPVYVNGKYAYTTAQDWDDAIYCWVDFSVTAEDILLAELTDVPNVRSGGYANTNTGLVSIPSDAKYSVTAVNWVKYLAQENKVEIVNGKYFASGNVYAMQVTLTPKAGYRFREPDVLVEGKESENFTYNEDGTLTVSVDYPLSQAITELHINGVKDPVLGQYASTTGITVTESSKVDVLKIWLDPETENIETGFTGKFVEDEYALIVAAYPKSGYHFAEDVKVYVNGELYPEAIADSKFVAGIQIMYDLRDPADYLVDRVDLTVDIPQPGKVVGPTVAQVPDGAKYKISWYHYPLDEGETYLDNSEYSINLELSPLEEYEFSEDVAIYVNGQPIDPDMVYQKTPYYLDIGMDYYFGDQISQVELEAVSEAVIGKKAPQDNWMGNNSTQQYDVYCTWYVWNPNINDWAEFYGTFEEGYYYRRDLYISLMNGCYFAEDVVVTVNGEPVAVTLGDAGYMEDIYTYYNFGADTRDSISVTGVSLPEIDAKADASSVKMVPGSGCELLLASWYASSKKDLNLDTWEETATFQTGKYHALMLAVRRKDDTPFDSQLTVVIDGVEYTDCMVYLYEDYAIVAVPFGKLYSGDSLPGDLNGDDEVTAEDVEALLMHSLYPKDYPVEVEVDYNGDGEITAADVEMLLMYFLYPEDFPLV